MTTRQKKLKVLDYAIDEVTNNRSTSICFPIQVGLENEGLDIYIGHANSFHFPTFYDYKPENPVGTWWFPNTPEGKTKRLEILESLKRDIKADAQTGTTTQSRR